MLFSMIRDVHSKHEYFSEHLKKERDELNTKKQIFLELKEDARINLNKNDLDCHKCWYSIYELDYNSISSYLSKYHRPIKNSYDDTLFPLQHLLIIIYYINTFSMTTIFETPFRLFFFSTLFTIINFCIQGELFIADAPNVYYTVTIAICIFLFSIYLLLEIMIVLLAIVHYRIMKNILTSQ
jgi:hypothetical protein